MIFRHKRSALLLVLFLVVAIPAFWWLGRPHPVAVLVGTVEKGSVEDTVANTRAGTIKACRRAGLSPSIGGQVVSLPVREGDRVKKGELLMEFWNADRSAELMLAQNKAKAARARTHEACVRADVARREARACTASKRRNWLLKRWWTRPRVKPLRWPLPARQRMHRKLSLTARSALPKLHWSEPGLWLPLPASWLV